jgi:hypothetical protein
LKNGIDKALGKLTEGIDYINYLASKKAKATA